MTARTRARTVRVVHRRVSSTFDTPDLAAAAVLRRVVPARAREFDALHGRWLVYASAVPKLVEALTAAGFTVETGGGCSR